MLTAERLVALYAYTAQNEDELTFEKDAIITVLSRDNPDWWQGEVNGQTGLFPSNYVTPMSAAHQSCEYSLHSCTLGLYFLLTLLFASFIWLRSVRTVTVVLLFSPGALSPETIT